MDLNESIDPIVKGVASGGLMTVLAAVFWKKIIEFRQDKRDDQAGQISQNAFTNIVKGLNEEIARREEQTKELRAENRALEIELSAEIKLRFATERKLEAALKGAQETVDKIHVVQDAAHEAAATASDTAMAVTKEHTTAGRILTDRIADLESELTALRKERK